MVTDDGLVAFDVVDGTRRWAFGGAGQRMPAVADHTVFAGGTGETSGLYALDIDTGEVRWRYRRGYLDAPSGEDAEPAADVGDSRWYRAAALWAAVKVTGPLALGGLVAVADRLADAGDGVEADPGDGGDDA